MKLQLDFLYGWDKGLLWHTPLICFGVDGNLFTFSAFFLKFYFRLDVEFSR